MLALRAASEVISPQSSGNALLSSLSKRVPSFIYTLENLDSNLGFSESVIWLAITFAKIPLCKTLFRIDVALKMLQILFFIWVLTS